MSTVDLRQAINAMSEVVVNRPPPLRDTDQIYMKLADMFLQADHVSRYMDKKRVVFIGDGDAIGLSIVHLKRQGILEKGPSFVHVLDFDERVVNSIKRFAKRKGYMEDITGTLYNVADPLPKELWQSFDVFYTNPPFGSSNEGTSIEIFVRRGIEAIGDNATGCIVMADYDEVDWPQNISYNTQQMMIREGFYVVEMIPRLHSYHLEDAPELTSCSLVMKRLRFIPQPYSSQSIRPEEKERFYGEDAPLRWKYIKDRLNGGKLPSMDCEYIGFEEDE
jgi:predicted methyltransferase